MAGALRAWAVPPSSPIPAPSTFEGDYVVGELGTIEITTDRNEARGSLRKAGRCAFEVGETLVDAAISGTVLVGTFATCVEGQGCQTPTSLPFMGVFSEGSITGFVTLDRGCTAPGLELKSEKPQTYKIKMQQTFESLERSAKKALAKKDFVSALPLLSGAVKRPEAQSNAQLHHLYGATLNAVESYAEGKRAIKVALELAKRGKNVKDEDRAVMLFNLACAEANLHEEDLAIEHLNEALQVNRAAVWADLSSDPELEPLRTHPEFQKLLGGKKGPR